MNGHTCYRSDKYLRTWWGYVDFKNIKNLLSKLVDSFKNVENWQWIEKYSQDTFTFNFKKSHIQNIYMLGRINCKKMN